MVIQPPLSAHDWNHREAPDESHGDQVTAIKLLVKGFSAMEQRLLQGVVLLSKRRAPRIELVADSEEKTADVVMLDAPDAQVRDWAATQTWLNYKPVIWVDASTARAGHTVIRRPVQWPVLPILLFKALEQGPQKTGAQSKPTNTSRQVLVVDDSLAVRAHLRSLLEPKGFSVAEAISAEAGIEAASSGNYACVLMDVMMPGIDGYEACRRIKSLHPRGGRIPAIVMLTDRKSVV